MNSSTDTYKIFSDFYDLYIGKFDSDLDFYKSYCNKTDKILEIGCGTGRILNVLLQEGCRLTGIDISLEMLDKAREKYYHQIQNGKLVLINHNFETDRCSDHFDRILLTFYTFNYILNRPVDFLSNIKSSINENGLLLMDLFYPNALYDKTIDGKWIDKELCIDGQTNKIRDCRTMDKDIEHRQQVFSINDTETIIDTVRKYYSPSTLKDMLETAGFSNIEFSYDYDHRKFAETIDESGLTNNYIVKAKV